MAQIIELPESCYFSDYFKLNYYLEDIVTHFGYSFELTSLVLPQSEKPVETIDRLRERLEESLPFVTLDSESARREFLIAPLVLELVHLIHVKVKVSYSLKATEQLKGLLDYYLQSGDSLLIIEAKDENLERGFKQLAAELIALDKVTDASAGNLLYGAVSIGRIWQFAVLDRQQKKISQDLELYRVPADVELLMNILVAILTNKTVED
ncbi:hypothetical protein N836_11280 [Leptolyngbya sp. Heron Island J]|uniref:hypothetical protein n=1 Tax=Leptolyngbya sp. Heron Island J TaxID=1385935 RepID=UPI0003B9528A|nr:hypothetical protein [Leptolyngbya sp. Heron Island J]ESA35573.1 hypothetical protein N836_11280 [Leptolyngbya sp. Heron Island J]